MTFAFGSVSWILVAMAVVAAVTYVERLLDLRRAQIDYQDFLKELKEDDVIYYLTRYGSKDPRQFDFTEVKGDIYLMFGKESTGIPKHILKADLDHCIRLPMVKEARSLNLSNTVAIMVYEVLGQLGYPGLCATETQKGADFLESHEFSETE